jgi:hypothetical protein
MRSPEGSRLYRTIKFKVFAADHRSHQNFALQALEGKFYTEDGVEAVKEAFLEELQNEFPGIEFKAIQVGRNLFNVVHQVGNS